MSQKRRTSDEGHKFSVATIPKSNKLQKFHAGMAPKWLGPFEVDKKLENGVYVLKSNPPVKAHASELKALPRPLRDTENTEEDQPRIHPAVTPPTSNDINKDPLADILQEYIDKEDVELRPRYKLRPRNNNLRVR